MSLIFLLRTFEIGGYCLNDNRCVLNVFFCGISGDADVEFIIADLSLAEQARNPLAKILREYGGADKMLSKSGHHTAMLRIN